MAKKKYKDMDVDEKFIHDAVGMKKVRIFSGVAALGLGVWMIITPEGLEHASTEKATVYLMKELWSPYLAAVLLLLGTYIVIKTIVAVKIMTGFTWVKQTGGHYVYNNKERVTGLKAISHGVNKIVFNSAQGEVYEFLNYNKLGLNKYRKVNITDEFNCNDTYWNADSNGYSMVHKG